MEYPILYSFRRWPYAIRARMALAYTNVKLEIREILLRDRPNELYQVSSKGTVPVLITLDGSVIDESLDIMLWALRNNSEQIWLNKNHDEDLKIINHNDIEFKTEDKILGSIEKTEEEISNVDTNIWSFMKNYNYEINCESNITSKKI